MTSVTQETSEKLSKELQSRVKEQSAEFHAKTTQVEENLQKDIGKLAALVQSFSDKVIAPLEAQDIKMGQIVNQTLRSARNRDLER